MVSTKNQKQVTNPSFVNQKHFFFQKMSSIYLKHRQSDINAADRRKSALKSPRKSKNYQQNRQPPRYRLFYEDEDVTPLPLNPYILEDSSEKQLSVYELSDSGLVQNRSTDKEVNIFGAQQHLSQLASQIYNQSITDTSGFMQSHITGNFDDFSIDEYAVSEASGRTVQSFASTESQQQKWKPPTHVRLFLVETETFFILDLPSSTAVKDTEEGKSIGYFFFPHFINAGNIATINRKNCFCLFVSHHISYLHHK